MTGRRIAAALACPVAVVLATPASALTATDWTAAGADGLYAWGP